MQSSGFLARLAGALNVDSLTDGTYGDWAFEPLPSATHGTIFHTTYTLDPTCGC